MTSVPHSGVIRNKRSCCGKSIGLQGQIAEFATIGQRPDVPNMSVQFSSNLFKCDLYQMDVKEGMSSFSDQLARIAGAVLLFKGVPRSMKLGFLYGTIGSLIGVALFWILRKYD